MPVLRGVPGTMIFADEPLDTLAANASSIAFLADLTNTFQLSHYK